MLCTLHEVCGALEHEAGCLRLHADPLSQRHFGPQESILCWRLRLRKERASHGIHAYLSAEKDGERLTVRDAARALGVSSYIIGRFIKTGVLPAIQVVPDAPYQIRSNDLHSEAVRAAIARKGCPCRTESVDTLPMFPDA